MTTASQLDLELKTASSDGWLTLVLDQSDEFLPDHAANERKASTMAMSMLAH
jgi:tRNA isopentenyl-2-thiomethyl-A-37 hydroxylase MiaE